MLAHHLQRIDQEVYHMIVAQLQQHVVAKNSKTSLETSSADGKTLVPVSEMGRITCDMEFRFMLHRHWSLYEVSVPTGGRVVALVPIFNESWRNTGNRQEPCSPVAITAVPFFLPMGQFSDLHVGLIARGCVQCLRCTFRVFRHG